MPGLGGNTTHTLPFPAHPSSSNIFQRRPNCGRGGMDDEEQEESEDEAPAVEVAGVGVGEVPTDGGKP